MKKLLLLSMLTFSGCATVDHSFRDNVQQLVDCEYRYASKNLTCMQIYDLQLSCYDLFKMREVK